MKIVYTFILIFMLVGCVSPGTKKNSYDIYDTPDLEAQWIRDGMPIDYAGTLWYPVDDIESFTDSEMLKIGEHNGVPYFVDRVDIKPYNRLYTKFGRNKFRYYEAKK